ncbi:tRNA pseudouridine(38-40) synthase TruA [Tessaracoccus sp. MC1865]|uniref:tRNA pseudouridine(38-40) synthase TruA n=1 Tax=unclassified Tessaracoccus TaxID=2635419 RepID=UPI0016041904|nr:MULTISPECIES: tRNA pseudouridine(38-40) synthase TruA [unclassified Tessaracoccus]MBB1483706.1 tRNA pseudouridine(38-40) synthase TruA [Tessaracoccus sp. MC1865]MBB1508783.1 tRNA pseudouridine(38-40) synthase TruA [Tessaracoccus sp. MC1756]QTO36775.1 tRNA pseudouridine(38-40) synthase TruA [Tessaracoccus sp. MC1865]
MRLRIDLAYDGTEFHGWATQPGLRTVQATLEEWIGKVLRLAGPPTLVVAGRTDAGVHARRQTCHADLDLDEDPSATLLRRLRRVLPDDIAIRDVTPAPEGFDARFSAIWRRYCYRLTDGVADPLLRGHITPSREPIDVGALNAAAELLIGLRDFAAFCRPRQGATTIRDLRELSATRRPDGVIEVHLLADAFCHSMVRSLMGALTAVAAGRRSLSWLEEVAASSVRHGEVQVMPARGLTLEEVGYPPDDELAARATAARAMRTLETS